MPFQRQVNLVQAPAVEGDFASANPRVSALTNPGGFVAALVGVVVAKFAWLASDGVTVSNQATAPIKPKGFVHREQQALVENYLQEYSMLVPVGFPVTLFNEGDFWARNLGPAAMVDGSAVYAGYSDGGAYTAAPTGAAATGSIGATFTATGAGQNLTVSAVTGLISIGDTIAGTDVPAGTTITGQTSGTTGGAGVYTTSVATTATAATVTAFGTTVNVTAVGSGIIKPGLPVSGTGVPTGATIASQISGATGGVGVYTIDVPATAYAASTALTLAGGIQTSFFAKGSAAVGELVKISTWGN